MAIDDYLNFPDLMSLDNPRSLARAPFAKQGKFVLSESDAERLSIPPGYTALNLKINSGKVAEMEKILEDVGTKMNLNLKKTGLYAPIYEALLNAFQHGNRRDVSKKVALHYKTTKSFVEVMVEDEGGVLDANFIPFILRHRDPKYLQKPTNFYDFVGIKMPETNHGTGTNFIHFYADQVSYHRSESDGLIVRIVKRINN